MRLNIRKFIMPCAYLYISLPIIIFLLGWVKFLISIPAAIVIIYCIYKASIKKNDLWLPPRSRRTILITASVFLMIIIWVWISGIGGYYYQDRDHYYRNEIFALLVEKQWPVLGTFTSGSMECTRMLVYYIGFWLPAAAFSKAFGINAGWGFQFIWAALGLVLIFFLLSALIKTYSVFPMIGFMLFSGMDLLGALICYGTIELGEHIEWWSGFQYSSNTTLLFWVFNQAIYGWLLILLILSQKDNKHIVFILGSGLLSCTFPFIGLIPFAVFMIYKNMVRNDKSHINWLSSAKKLFSFENVAGGGLSGIISFLYLMSNTSAGKSDFAYFSDPTFGGRYIFFCLMEFGLLMLLMIKEEKKNPLYLITAASLFVCPLVVIGDSQDFCMRASIPALVVLYILFCNNIKKALSDKAYLRLAVILLIFGIGVATPFQEIYRHITNMNIIIENNLPVRMLVPEEYVMEAPNFSCDVKDSVFYKVLSR